MRVKTEGTIRIKTDESEKYFTNTVMNIENALIAEIGLTIGSKFSIGNDFSVKLIKPDKLLVTDGIFKDTTVNPAKYTINRGVSIGHGKITKTKIFSGPSYSLSFKTLDV